VDTAIDNMTDIAPKSRLDRIADIGGGVPVSPKIDIQPSKVNIDITEVTPSKLEPIKTREALDKNSVVK
jgi:hypothetical protein